MAKTSVKTNSEFGELVLERPNKTIYKSTDGTKIVKVFNHEIVDKSTVLFEALNQSYVEKTGLNIPKVTKVFKNGDDWCLESEYIEGQTLQQLMDKDKANKKKYIEKLVDLQLEVLSYKVPELVKLKDKLNAKISFMGKKESKYNLEATVRYDLHVRLENMPNHSKLCHGDFNPSNIVVTKDNKYYILDWAHATQGNASADASRTYLDFILNGDEEGAKLYLHTFAAKADIAVQYIQHWICVVSATLLNQSRNEKEKELLLRNINVVESF